MERLLQSDVFVTRSGEMNRRNLVLTATALLGLAGCSPSPVESESSNSAATNAPIFEGTSIGMRAPNIVGVDIDGVEFQLSDYRGKVVMLDFWGDW